MLGSTFAHEGASVVYRQGKIERRQLQFHPPRFNLGKVQDLIDKGEQMAAGGKDIVGVLGLLLV